MSTRRYVGVAVPFTAEEILILAAFARSEGSSIVELVRTRALALRDDAEAASEAGEDLATAVALLEGFRVRGRPRD